jgi:hypothetical protein
MRDTRTTEEEFMLLNSPQVDLHLSIEEVPAALEGTWTKLTGVEDSKHY